MILRSALSITHSWLGKNIVSSGRMLASQACSYVKYLLNQPGINFLNFECLIIFGFVSLLDLLFRTRIQYRSSCATHKGKKNSSPRSSVQSLNDAPTGKDIQLSLHLPSVDGLSLTDRSPMMGLASHMHAFMNPVSRAKRVLVTRKL